MVTNTGISPQSAERGERVKPYYEADGITIYCGDCREILPLLDSENDDLQKASLVFDPPYGISYYSNHISPLELAREIENDDDTSVRDDILYFWGKRRALVFGSWKMKRPENTKMLLVWDTGGALGMGDLSLPWKPSHQEIYVIGSGFHGRRDTDVLRFPPVQSTKRNGRLHPHEKPIALMQSLIKKCPICVGHSIIDPCMGTGTTLLAAKNSGYRAVGIEIEERYCEIAANRLAQGVLFAPGGAL